MRKYPKNFDLKKEREKSNSERLEEFRINILNLIDMLMDGPDPKTNRYVCEVVQAVLIFTMRDIESGYKEIYIDNVKSMFYDALEKLEGLHKDARSHTCYIRLFMEDFYFNKKADGTMNYF